MPNKNDLSDLAKFSAWLAALVFAAVLLFCRAAALAEEIFGDDVRAAAAAISDRVLPQDRQSGK
ncbi:MAG: hypothetical protein YFSK_5710 [Candidatus Yanofskyibacterium parasiticum]|nr:MAG: hypothetical protein YFSK_5710 [Candidatus Yanofskybacteria bacterium]